MKNKNLHSTYEKIMLTQKLPYWAYWFLIGVGGFIAGEFLVNAFGETHYLVTQALFAITIAAIPIISVWMSRNFRVTMLVLASVLWDDKDVFETWLNVKSNQIFTMKTWASKFIMLSSFILAFATIATLGLPFKSAWLNFFALLGFAPLVAVNAQFAYTLIALFWVCREVAARPVKEIPFGVFKHKSISSFQNYLSMTTFLTTVGYIIMVSAIWLGPYGMPTQAQLWVAFGSFYPLSMIVLSFFYLHALMQNIKYYNLDIISNKIKPLLDTPLEIGKPSQSEQLEKMLSIQNKIQEMKELPIEIQGILTFVLTIITAIVQVTISLLGILKP